MKIIPPIMQAIIASFCLAAFILFAVDLCFILFINNQVNFCIAIPICFLFGVIVFCLLLRNDVYKKWYGNPEKETTEMIPPIIAPPPLGKKEHQKKLQLLKKSISKSQISAERLSKLLNTDKQISDRLIREAKADYRSAYSQLMNEYFEYGSDNGKRIPDFIAHLVRGCDILGQYVGVNSNGHEFKTKIIENSESIAEDAKYVIVNWTRLGFYIQD